MLPAEPLLLATANPHKVDELRALLAPAGVAIEGLGDLRDAAGRPIVTREPSETGDTFDANAAIKALDYARQTGRWCLADDSGLEIDALGGKPGVISSHFCTDGRDVGMTREQRDLANNQRVLRDLSFMPIERRAARFVCVMALAKPGRLLLTVRGTFEGRIGVPGSGQHNVPRGDHGFGYDPLFLVAPEFTRTSAELSPAEKNAHSHRGAAARALIAKLRENSAAC